MLYNLLSGASFAGVDLDFTLNNFRVNGQFATRFEDLSGATTTASGTEYVANSAGVLVPVSANTLGVTDLGASIYAGRTNLESYSEDYSQSVWTFSNAGQTAAATTAPNGLATASKIAETTGAGLHGFASTSNLTVTAGVPYTLSRFVKAAERTYCALYESVSGKGKFFNLSTGAILGNLVGAPDSASITALANGWYLISITVTPAGTSLNSGVYLSTDGTTFIYTGTSASGIYVWGAQTSAVAGPYVPTTGTTAARGSDQASITFAGSPALATIYYGTSSTATVSNPTSPFNFGVSSGGAWVNNNVRKIEIK